MVTAIVRLIVSPGTRSARLTIAVAPRSVVIATLPEGVGVGDGVAVGVGGFGMNGGVGAGVRDAAGELVGTGDGVAEAGGGVDAAGG